MASSRKERAARERRLLRQHARETGRPVKTTLHVGDLLTDAELEAAGRVYRPEFDRKRALTAQVQAREAAERAERRRSDAGAAGREAKRESAQGVNVTREGGKS